MSLGVSIGLEKRFVGFFFWAFRGFVGAWRLRRGFLERGFFSLKGSFEVTAREVWWECFGSGSLKNVPPKLL